MIESERLASALRDAGHEVWLDEWEIAVGDSIVERIDAGLSSAAYVVVCYSTAGIDSLWMKREWLSALANQLNGRDVKLLPVLLGGEPPAILADVKYADLSGDWTNGIADLLLAIR